MLVLSGGIAALVGVLFGIPSLRIKGLYLAVATLAAQFFIDWLFARVKWFTNYSSSGFGVDGADRDVRLDDRHSGRQKYLFVLTIAVVMTLAAKNLVRGHIGRAWMAIRDMDVAAEVIGIRPLYAKLIGVRGQLVLCRRRGRPVGVYPTRRLGTTWRSISTYRSTCCS